MKKNLFLLLTVLLTQTKVCRASNSFPYIFADNKQAALIVGGTVAAAFAYGALHTGITYSLYPTLYNILQKPKHSIAVNPLEMLPDSIQPSLEMGVLFGSTLATAAQIGKHSPVGAREALKSLVVPAAAVSVAAVTGGVYGYFYNKKAKDQCDKAAAYHTNIAHQLGKAAGIGVIFYTLYKRLS